MLFVATFKYMGEINNKILLRNGKHQFLHFDIKI